MRKNTLIVHRLDAVSLMTTQPGQKRRGYRVQPVQLGLHTQTSVVGVSNGSRTQSVGNRIDRRRKTVDRIDDGSLYACRRERKAERVIDEVRRSLHRQHLVMREVNRKRLHVRTILH